MKRLLLGSLVGALALVMVVPEADAKRLGGARSSGTQRQAPEKPMQKAPAQDAQPGAAAGAGAGAAPASAATASKAAPAAAAAAGTAATAARRSWMGPLLGLAAGLGLASLFSALGMGEAFSSFVMMALIAVVAIVAVRFIMNRMRGGNAQRGATPALAGAAAGAGVGGGTTFGTSSDTAGTGMARQQTEPQGNTSGLRIGTALQPPMAVPGLNDGANALQEPAARQLPADFDAPAFERIARTIFIRMQTANDASNLTDLRAFTTPEMFAEFQTDLMARGDTAQTTEVVSVNPTVIDVVEEDGQRIVSVRYVGVIREDVQGPAQPFDEVWHLVNDGVSPAWRIAGIQQIG
jgi:predicted lipid-binding transport protein (Tim44 family)